MATELGRTTLEHGGIARIHTDDYGPGLVLEVDGTAQSHVNPADPTDLRFEYVARIGNALDVLAPRPVPLTAVHLGAGALTIPRFIAATRPGSRQQVIELEPRLVELVREHLPLDRRSGIRVRYGDARAGLARLPASLAGAADLAVVDVYAGSRAPSHLTTVEFFRELDALLAPTGLVAVNVTDVPGTRFLRSIVRTLGEVYPHVLVTGSPYLFQNKGDGNAVVLARHAAFPDDLATRLVSLGPHPAKVIRGDELTRYASGAPISSDAQPARHRV